MVEQTEIRELREERAEVELKSHDISHRKKIGAFYTPLTISTALSSWGIRAPTDLVLEPCFGGCTFLEAAIVRLNALGHETPEDNLFGCDIDPLAFSYLKRRVEQAKLPGHFFEQDFIEFAPAQLKGSKVDLVIGNPPYIRHSNFTSKQRDLLGEWAKDQAIKLHGRANLWAYFVLHALQFIKDGGRLALVLPGSFLYADYSEPLRNHLRKHFKNLMAVTLIERLFISEGTEETTVVLLGDGFGHPPSNDKIRIACVDSVDDLIKFMGNRKAHDLLPDHAYFGHGMVPVEVGALHHKLASTFGMSALDKIATMRIGLVTGDTPFFIKSKSEWRAFNIDRRHLKYILPKSQFVKGVLLDPESAEQHILADIRCLALSTPAAPRAENLVNYLERYPAEAKKKNATFQKRSLWHRFTDDYRIPDAFFVFMTGQGPRIILNDAGAISTNSVYRIFFNDNVKKSQMKLAAISMCTTFTQLAAEIIGHPRGSGALKLEPSSALSLKLYMPDIHELKIDEAFDLINIKLRQKDVDGARDAADALLFADGKFAAALPFLRTGLATVRQRRVR